MAVRDDDSLLLGEPEGSPQGVRLLFRQRITMDLEVPVAVHSTVPHGSGRLCIMFTALKTFIMGLLMTDQVLFLWSSYEYVVERIQTYSCHPTPVEYQSGWGDTLHFQVIRATQHLQNINWFHSCWQTEYGKWNNLMFVQSSTHWEYYKWELG